MNTPILSSKRFCSSSLALTVILMMVIAAGCKNKSGVSDVGTSPRVMTTFPEDNASDVAVNTTISARFSEEMNPETLTDSSFILRNDTLVVQGRISYADSTVNFSPSNDLNFEGTYTVTITTGAQNLSGSSIERDHVWGFTTVPQDDVRDTEPPEITSTSPAADATGVSVNTAVTVDFSEPINPSTINEAAFFLTEGNSRISANVSYANSTATLTPVNSLDFGTNYTATVSTSVEDTAGNTLEETLSWSFTTGNQPDNTAPQIESTIPTDNETDVPVTSNITVTFNEAINTATITAESFFLEQGNNAIEGGLSFSSDGTSVTFDPDNNLEFEEDYTVTLTTDIEDLAGNNLASTVEWDFTTSDAPDTEAPRVNDVEPDNNENNVPIDTDITITFSESISESSVNSSTILLEQGNSQVQGSFEVSGNIVTFNPSSNLQYETVYDVTVTTGVEDLAGNNMESSVEWDFTTRDAPDTEAPEIDDVDPNNNENDVPINTNITITFTEAINESTVNLLTIFVEQGNLRLPGAFNVSGNVVTFNPTFNLQYETDYTVTVTTGVEDLAGNNLENEEEWDFETEQEPDDDDPEVDSRTPGIDQQDVGINTNVIVNFNEAIAQATVNSSTFLLEDGNTQIPAGYSTSGSTATLNPNNNLDYQTVYTVTLTTGIQDLAGNGLTNTVTWDFTTMDPPDTTPPIVDSTTPTDNANNVAISTNITATFSEAMNEQSAENAFSISPSESGSFSFAGNTLTFNPNADLEFTTLYTITISTGAQDLAGNSLENPEEWSFTTSEPPDTTPPTVISPTPAAGDTNVPVNITIEAEFDEAIDPSTIDNTTFIVADGSTIVEGNLSINGSIVTFNPFADLSGSTQYVVTITTEVADLAGNTLESNFVWDFVTEL